MPAFIDQTLDRLVVPGYTSAGFSLRERGWDKLPQEALAGRHVLITGASSGIGAAAAAGAAHLGATVHMLVRNPEKGERAKAEIASDGADPERLRLWTCDISDLDAVSDFAADFTAEVPALSGLVHNAGVMTQSRERSAQGHELTFATHVLGPYVLTRLLKPALDSGAPSSVIFVTSGGMYTTGLDAVDPQLEQRDFDGTRFYAHVKRIQVILAEELAVRAVDNGVAYASMHPGWVDTPGLRRSLPRFSRLTGPLLRSSEQGADTIIWLLASGAAAQQPGALWHDRRARPAHVLPRTSESAADRERLLASLEELTPLPQAALTTTGG